MESSRARAELWLDPRDRSVGGLGGQDELRDRFENDQKIQADGPIFEVIDVGFHSIDDVCVGLCFTALALDLRQAGDAWLHKTADAISLGNIGECSVVGRKMRAGADDTHGAEQHVEKLRKLVDAQLSEPPSHGEDAGVILGGLDRFVRVVWMHCAKFPQDKGSCILPRPHLPAEERSRRLNPLDSPYQ